MQVGQFCHRLVKAFGHNLAGKIYIHVVFKIHVHYRHAGSGRGLDMTDAGQAVHS